METFSWFSLMFMVLAAGNGDLLDQISTDAYWKSKAVKDLSVEKLIAEITPAPAVEDLSPLIKALGSENFAQREQATNKLQALGAAALPALEKASNDPDPEVARRARELIRQANSGAKVNQVRRLMAIRTLGELGKAEALPALKPLLSSKEIFVPEYAARAIAAIEGKPFPPPGQKAGMSRDLALLPADCGILGQLRNPGGRPRTIDKFFEKAPNEATSPQEFAGIVQKMVNAVIEITDQVGNVRLDGVTLAVSDNVGDNSGFIILLARGQYDVAAVEAMLTRTNLMTSEKVDEVKLWAPANARELALFFPSNEQAILVAGPKRELMPIKSLIAAVKAGENSKGLNTNAALTRLMSRIDTTQALWGVAKIQESFRKEKVFEAFDSITLEGRQEKGGTIFELKGEGKEAAKVATAVATINKGIEEARKDFAKVQIPLIPARKMIASFLESMKCEALETTAVLKARLEGENASQLLMMLGFWTMAHEVGPAQPLPQPLPPPPPPPPVKEKPKAR